MADPSRTPCARAEEWISSQVDGEELPSAARSALDEHLAACPSCRRLLAAEGERSALLAGALRGAGAATLGEKVLARVQEADWIAAAGSAGAAGVRVRRALGIAASLLVATGLGFSLAWIILGGGPRTSMEIAREPGSAVTPPLPRSPPLVEVHLEERLLGAEVVPAADGAPLLPSVVRERWIILGGADPLGERADPLGEGDGGAAGAEAPSAAASVRLELESVMPGYEKLASWPYR
jgi:hypothetical protein